MLQAVSISIDAVMSSVDRGLALAAASRELKSEAAATHPKLANMLSVCAAALATHPTPALLCERNQDRLNEECRGDRHERWPAGMQAAQVAGAAEAFGVAARILRQAGVG
jgi:hypothetical protein